MVKDFKVTTVEELAETLSRSSIAIVTDNKGVNANGITQLRKILRDAGVEYKVVKNTLMVLAAEKVNRAGIKPMLQGPTAIAFAREGDAAAAKILSDYVRTSGSSLKIKGALLGGKTLDARQVAILASLPSREALLSDLLGKMKSPISATVFVLSSPIRGIMGVLQARVRQMESEPAA